MHIVHLIFPARDGRGSALRDFLVRAIPSYESLHGTRVQLVRDAIAPARLIKSVHSATLEAFATNKHRLAHAPQIQALIAEWHSLIDILQVATRDKVTATATGEA